MNDTLLGNRVDHTESNRGFNSRFEHVTDRLARRASALRAALAWRALDTATDPKKPRPVAAAALALYTRMGVNMHNTENAQPEAEAEISPERATEPIIEALEKMYPGATFERIGDTVVCTDQVGIDLGDPKVKDDPARSWAGIMALPKYKDERFLLVVGGVRHDTRFGMTAEVYEQMIQNAIAAGSKIPDRGGAVLQGVTLQRCLLPVTLLTGEELNEFGEARCVYVHGDQAVFTSDGLEYGGLDMRFRPAVQVI